MNDIKRKINKENGKVIVTGTIDDEVDFQEIHDSLPKAREEIEALRETIKSQEESLGKIEPVIFDGELEKLKEMLTKLQTKQKRENMEADLAVKKSKLAQMEKFYEEQLELDKEYVKYLEKVKE